MSHLRKQQLRNPPQDRLPVDHRVFDPKRRMERENGQAHTRRREKHRPIDEPQGMIISVEEFAGRYTAHEFVRQDEVPFRPAAT